MFRLVRSSRAPATGVVTRRRAIQETLSDRRRHPVPLESLPARRAMRCWTLPSWLFSSPERGNADAAYTLRRFEVEKVQDRKNVASVSAGSGGKDYDVPAQEHGLDGKGLN